MSDARVDWAARYRELSPRIEHFIDGRHRSGQGRMHCDKFSPRDGRLLCSFEVASEETVDNAVSSARRAFEDGRWSKMAVLRRSEILNRLARLIEEHHEELALLECVDVGKPISDALSVDVPMAATVIRFYAEAVNKVYSKVYSADQSSLSYEARRPVGVVGAIVGWNFPLVLAAQKIGPALAAGNCVVLKPSELTSLSALRLAELAIEAGVPEGVLNVVHGNGHTGALLAHHRDVRLLTFTGSTQTGKDLLIAAGRSNMKRLILECGGKAPNIVFDDCASLAGVAESVIKSAFWNLGQVCVASSRLLVHEQVKDALLAELVRKSSALRLGDPLDRTTTFGALVSANHKRRVLEYIELGQQEGARISYRCHSPAPLESGFYLGPVIFDQVTADRRIAQEEIFGPVLCVLSFRDEDEAVAIANSSRYGLSATIWTRDIGRAHRMSQAIDAGWVIINTVNKPAGGPPEGVIAVGGHKESGVGVEGGIDGLDAYMAKSAIQMFV